MSNAFRVPRSVVYAWITHCHKNPAQLGRIGMILEHQQQDIERLCDAVCWLLTRYDETDTKTLTAIVDMLNRIDTQSPPLENFVLSN